MKSGGGESAPAEGSFIGGSEKRAAAEAAALGVR